MDRWRSEFDEMRAIALDCNLTEQVKCGCPCYTKGGRNIVLIHGFKDYCAYLFFKGALLNDPDRLLIQQTENVQAARQIRFTNLEQIRALQSTLKAYIRQAIQIEASGRSVQKKKTEDFPVAEEFAARLAQQPALAGAFAALSPGRQRAYLLYFAAAKQSQTRDTRIEACVPRIIAGQGLRD